MDGLAFPFTNLAIAVAVMRPISGFLAFSGSDLPKHRKWVISFFGIRGIGLLYYLAYGIYMADFPQSEEFWAIIILIVTVSVFIHGMSANPVMDRLDSAEKKRVQID